MRKFRILLRYVAAVIAIVSACLAVYAWNWMQSLPYSPHRVRCGNCLLPYVLLPVQLAIAGALWFIRDYFAIANDWEDGLSWISVLIGLVLTPTLVGLPFFPLGVICLIWSAMTAGSGRARSVRVS